MLRKLLISLNLILVCVLFIEGLSATFYLKQILRDGASWAYRVYNTGFWAVDFPFIRYSSAILQTPSVLAVKMDASPAVVYWLFCFNYFLYPFLALVLIYFYLRKENKLQFLYPLLLSFFLTILPTWAFANSVAPEAVVISWFLFTYILTEESPKLFILGIFSFLLLISYELGAIFYGLAVWLLWREKKIKLMNFFLFVIFAALQALNLFSKVFPGKGHKFFNSSVEVSYETPLLYLIIFLIPALFFLWSRYRALKIIALLGGFILVGIALKDIQMIFPSGLWIDSYYNRVWCIPVTFLILLSFYEFGKSSKFRLNNYHLTFLLACLLPGLLIDMRQSIDAKRVIAKVEKINQENKGCMILNFPEYGADTTQSYQPAWDLPYISVILQRKKIIETVLIHRRRIEATKFECKFSEDLRRLRYPYEDTTLFMNTGSRYDFSKLYKK